MQAKNSVVETLAQVDQRLVANDHTLRTGRVHGFGPDRDVPSRHDNTVDTGLVYFLLEKAQPLFFANLIHGRSGSIGRQDIELALPREPPQLEVKQNLERYKRGPHAEVDNPSVFLLTHDGLL